MLSPQRLVVLSTCMYIYIYIVQIVGKYVMSTKHREKDGHSGARQANSAIFTLMMTGMLKRELGESKGLNPVFTPQLPRVVGITLAHGVFTVTASIYLD